MREIPSIALADLGPPTRSITYGIVQPGKPADGGVPIVRVNNFRGHRLDLTERLCVALDVEAQYSRSRPRPNDILISLVGSIGQVAIAGPEISGWNLARAVGLIPTKDRHHALWIFYALQSPDAQRYIRQHANTTVQATFNLKDLTRFPIPYPEFQEREQIIRVLGSLDDKIELNRRMNETLEAMAQAIFRDWFVDFGPTRRKLEGATDPLTIMGGLVQDTERAQALANLFPATLGDDGLPEGWTFKPLDKSLVLQRGFDLPKSSRTDGSYPVIAASGPSGTHSEFKVSAPGVCTGRSGVLGNVFYVQQDFWPLNTSLWIKEYPNATPIYAYFLLKEIDLLALNAGSAVPTLNRNHVHNRPTVTPPMAVVSAYSKIAEMLMVKADQAAKECQTLEATCDLLLPKLMSGEIRLSEAEELMEAAQ